MSGGSSKRGGVEQQAQARVRGRTPGNARCKPPDDEEQEQSSEESHREKSEEEEVDGRGKSREESVDWSGESEKQPVLAEEEDPHWRGEIVIRSRSGSRRTDRLEKEDRGRKRKREEGDREAGRRAKSRSARRSHPRKKHEVAEAKAKWGPRPPKEAPPTRLVSRQATMTEERPWHTKKPFRSPQPAHRAQQKTQPRKKAAPLKLKETVQDEEAQTGERQGKRHPEAKRKRRVLLRLHTQ